MRGGGEAGTLVRAAGLRGMAVGSRADALASGRRRDGEDRREDEQLERKPWHCTYLLSLILGGTPVDCRVPSTRHSVNFDERSHLSPTRVQTVSSVQYTITNRRQLRAKLVRFVPKFGNLL